MRTFLKNFFIDLLENNSQIISFYEKYVSEMRKKILNIIFYFFSFSFVYSLDIDKCNELMLETYKGNHNAAQKLSFIKKNIEQNEDWDDETKDIYVTITRILSIYCNANNLTYEGETILYDAISTFQKRDSTINSQYSRVLYFLLASTYFHKLDYKKANHCGHVVLNMFNELNIRDVDYAQLCNLISSCYLFLDDMLSAKLYADEALDAMLDCLAENSEISKNCGYFSIQNTRGMIFFKSKQYEKAISCFKDIIANVDSTIYTSDYFNAKTNLALTFFTNNKLEEAVNIWESLPKNSTFESTITGTLAYAYYVMKKYDKAIQNLHIYNNMTDKNIYSFIKWSSERSREIYLNNILWKMYSINNMVAYNNPQATEIAFNSNLKARYFTMGIEHIKKSMKPSLYNSYSSLRNKLTQKDMSPNVFDSIHSSIIDIEKELLNRKNSSEKINSYCGDYKMVGAGINKSEAFILFCYLPDMNYRQFESHYYYGAYIVKHGNKQPIQIRLDNANNIDHVILNHNPSTEFISILYSEHNAKKLYKSLWEPLEPYLENIDNIYYSTIGPLASINFDALMNKDGQRLRDFKNLTMLSSPTIKEQLTSSYDYSSFFAIGSPSFNLSQKEMAEKASEYENFSGTDISDNLALFREKLRGDWQEIPGTRKEIESIHSLFSNKEIESKIYIGKDATEESIKALSGKSPKILHFATHGFVISTVEQYNNTSFVQSLQSLSERNLYMMWSGLVLAGGNNTWNGKFPPENVEDGILTAEEISRLDLSNTDLVVLSACETARGHIDPLEGVWGLQRAFKLAGAKTILMTLWKVSDEITAMFMEEFYKQLLNGKSVRQSVKEAQDYLIQNGASDPFYWAPFVVLD